MNLTKLSEMTNEEIIYWLMDEEIIHKEKHCSKCMKKLTLCPTKRSKDGFAWRCYNFSCSKQCCYVSVRDDSFFADFSLKFKTLLQSIYYWANSMIQEDILKFSNISRSILKKLKKKLIKKIENFYNDNPIILGGPNRLIQIDETKLNHKIKAHRVESSSTATMGLGNRGLFVCASSWFYVLD